MARHRKLFLPLVFSSAIAVLAGCNSGPSVSGAFDRSYVVTGPIRLELNNASGDVDITGSADGKVHVRGEVRASGFGFDNPQKRLDDTLASPPIEQKGDTIRIGKDMSRMRHISIAYTIQVPQNTEITTNVASGAQTIRNVAGPVTVRAASGSIRLEKVERDVELTTASGTISASNVGNDLHVSTASGNVNVSNVKGDVRANAVSGVVRIANPGARVDASDTSGEIEIQGASNDVKAHAISGLVSVQGNPSSGSYWDLKTVSGGVQLRIPAAANFHLSAEAASGEIRSDIPIVVEEQGKRFLRAHMGSGGGRVEIHTVSGEIRVSATK
jgi:Putative adhesin